MITTPQDSKRIPSGIQAESAQIPGDSLCARHRVHSSENREATAIHDPHCPRATPPPVDNPGSATAAVMDGNADSALFDGYESPPRQQLSAGQRLTQRQAAQIAAGTHPLTLNYAPVLALHPDADAFRTANSPQDGTPTCGNCRFRELLGYHGKKHPKCTQDGMPISHSAATDVRAWWPGCNLHEPAGDD